MIRFQLYPHQKDLIPELQKLFPDLAVREMRAASNIYESSLAPGQHGIQQIQYLHAHGLGYVNLDRQREKLIRAFFCGVELDDGPIYAISIRRPPTQPDKYIVDVASRGEQFSLHLPSWWNWPDESLVFEYEGWLCVYQTEQGICAAKASRDGVERQPIYQSHTLEEMEAWLTQHYFGAVIRLPPTMGVFGLYKLIEWPDKEEGTTYFLFHDQEETVRMRI